jgi:glycosyltransferase involved in cell wall biosynthesis
LKNSPTKLNSKIVVITHGRFHSFDLAEQLQDAGRLAAIYTGYPKFIFRNTRVDPRFIRSFPWFQTPAHALGRLPWISQEIFRDWNWYGSEALNRYAAWTLPECGLVTALSGSGSRAGAEIQRRGGVYVCDRGSTHILWVQKILSEEYESLGLHWGGIDPRPVANEIREYALADAVTVPSTYAKNSFIAMGVPASKLKIVPYGVNLKTFRQSADRSENFRVLYVGGLSVHKGVHYLLDAFHRANLPNSELVLVGGRTGYTDALLKRYSNKGVTLTGPVPREEVSRQMSRASVMVLPSVDDGFGLVLAQALACGCPIIATTHTGGPDLIEDGREGFIVAPRDAETLAERMIRLYRSPDLRQAMSAAALERVKSIGGWEQYGRASLTLFDALMHAKNLASP